MKVAVPYLNYQEKFASNGLGICEGREFENRQSNLALKIHSSTTVEVCSSAPIVAIPCYGHTLFRLCQITPVPNANESTMSIIATVTCKNRKVIFFNSLFPIYAPAIPASVAQTTKVILALSPALVNLVA